MRFHLTSSLLLLLVFADAQIVQAGPLERVPEDGTLAQAILRVSNHGTIDVAAGTYAVPSGGLRIRNKSVTVRARGGGPVVLDGQGSSTLVRIESRGAGSGDSVAFEGITFKNGFTADTTRAGAVTIDAASAAFASCVFDANAASGPDTRGGAIQVRGASRVRIVNSRFTDNTAGQWGAGIFAIEGSTIDVLWSEFRGNRTDLPGQGPGPAGAAIYLLDSTAHVRGSNFENNRSGWVAGAILAYGTFRNPASEPSAFLEVVDSTFVGNRALPNPCCSVSGPPSGGAIHVENQTTLVVRNSRFRENVSNFGGAIGSYRALIEIEDSEFRGNLTVPFAGVAAAGGTINVTSSEVPDGTNGNGAINRPPGAVHIARSFIQGRFGSTGVAAQQGGCIFATGDGNSFEGLGGMPQHGTAADNRAPVTLTDVVLADCDVESGAESRALGGAVLANLADVEIDGSVIFNSDSLGDTGSGGALASIGDSVVRASGSAFGRNAAEERGGAILMSGGRVEIDDCLFLENDVSPGVAERVQDSTGAALALSPAPASGLDVTGFVSDSVFTGNVGLPIVDIDFATGSVFNKVVYDGNRIHSTTFGDQVYKNLTQGFSGLTVAELNALVIARPGGATTVKSEVDNVRLASAPRDGRSVAAPSRVLTSLTPAEDAPSSAFLGYVWSGNTSSIAGDALPDKVGFVEVDRPGSYQQRLNGQNFTALKVGEEGCSGGGTLCLNGERFLVEVAFRDFNGNVDSGSVVPGFAGDSGLYYFFSEDNWEMLVKVLDGCRITDRFWVFAAATTNVEYTLRVTDKETGATKSYFNPLGSAASAVTDTLALDACSGSRANGASFPVAGLGPAPEPLTPGLAGVAGTFAKQANCEDGGTEILLNKNRFRVTVDWQDFSGNTGSGQVVPFCSDDSGLFFFFDEDNVEMLVKVLDGCAINGNYWVFSAATTNVKYTLTVTDTETSRSKSYFNRLGEAAPAIVDTGALRVCP